METGAPGTAKPQNGYLPAYLPFVGLRHNSLTKKLMPHTKNWTLPNFRVEKELLVVNIKEPRVTIKEAVGYLMR